MLKPRNKMDLSELAQQVRWFRELAALYEKNSMADTANRFNALAAEYQDEMERRPDSAE